MTSIGQGAPFGFNFNAATANAGEAQQALSTLSNGLPAANPFASGPGSNVNPFASAPAPNVNPFASAQFQGADPFASGPMPNVDPYAGPPPAPAALPKPAPSLAGAPAGEGLKNAGSHWPKGSITTAGGYTVVPKGNAKWEIFAPGQKPSAKPMNTIWGDPHVNDQSGKRLFDFSKSSDFLLPDGTRIACKTTKESGHSLSHTLDITNNMDHVTISHVDGKPTTGKIDHTGLEWRESHLAQNKKLETFKLGGSIQHATWFKEVGDKDEGQITGAKFDKGSYHQVTNGKKKYWVDPKLKPPVGSVAYGNMLRSQLDDQIGQMAEHGLPEGVARLLSNVLHFESAGSEIKHGVSEAVDGVKEAIGGAGELGHAFGDGLKGIGELFHNPFGGLVDLLHAGGEGITGVKDVIAGGKETFGGVHDGIHGVEDGFAALTQLGNTASDFFDSLLGIKHRQLAAW